MFGPTPCLDVLERCRDDLGWARERRNRSLEGSVLTRMGEMLGRSGNVVEAQDAFAEARSVFEALGGPRTSPTCRSRPPRSSRWRRTRAGAEAELRPAYEFFKQVGADHINATIGPMLAASLVPQGKVAEAIALCEEAERLAAPDDLDGQVKWRLAKAAAMTAEGDHGAAERLVREALALAEATDTVVLHADALAALAYTLICAGHPGDAVEPAASATELYELKGDVVSASRWQAALQRARRT